MGGKKSGENTKKAAGNAKKAEVAAQKQAAADAAAAAAKDQEWSKGAKSNAKKEADAEKKADAARKRAERDALLAQEEATQRSTPKNANAKTATKKSSTPRSAGTLDLSQLDSPGSPNSPVTLNATGIDNALDALSLTTDAASQKLERHPERRFKAAYAAFEERRLPEIAKERPGLRRQQRVQVCREEFEKSEENPFNQVGIVGFDASKEEMREKREGLRREIEGRLGEEE